MASEYYRDQFPDAMAILNHASQKGYATELSQWYYDTYKRSIWTMDESNAEWVNHIDKVIEHMYRLDRGEGPTASGGAKVGGGSVVTSPPSPVATGGGGQTQDYPAGFKRPTGMETIGGKPISNVVPTMDTTSQRLQALTEELASLKAAMGMRYGGSGNMAGSPLIIAESDVVKNRLAELGRAWWEAHGGSHITAETRPNALAELREYLGSSEVASRVAGEFGVSEGQVSMKVASMLAAGASALVMIATGGNFPLGAAAYFGVQAAFAGRESDGTQRSLFAGVENPAGAMLGDRVITPLANITLPEGLPNEIFAQYRFICYDRLSARWYPSDEIRPLEYESNEDYRWLCLDRVAGKVYKANLIKKARIYLQ